MGRGQGAEGCGLDGWGGTHGYLLERLLPGVRAYVVVECGSPSERTATVSTFEGSVA